MGRYFSLWPPEFLACYWNIARGGSSKIGGWWRRPLIVNYCCSPRQGDHLLEVLGDSCLAPPFLPVTRAGRTQSTYSALSCPGTWEQGAGRVACPLGVDRFLRQISSRTCCLTTLAILVIIHPEGESPASVPQPWSLMVPKASHRPPTGPRSCMIWESQIDLNSGERGAVDRLLSHNLFPTFSPCPWEPCKIFC